MIEIAFSSSFKRAFKKRVRGHPVSETRFWEKVAIFKNDPFDPRLRTHKDSELVNEALRFLIRIARENKPPSLGHLRGGA